jgi:site-specific DNA-methyltransferase (adenine-specific)
MVLARKPLEGTVANNVLTYGTGGLNIDGTRVGSQGGTKASETFASSESITAYGNGLNGNKKPVAIDAGRFPANFIHDGSDEVVALFPEAGNKWKRNYGTEDYEGKQYAGGTFGGGGYNGVNTYADSGSAARFFYCAKASKRDRNEGLDGFNGKEIGAKGNGLARKCATCFASVIDGCNCPDRTFVNPTRANHHPTVKPTTLMQYLVRLVTPPNGIVLDPFMGSGSTGKACAYEGFDFIGIDQSAEYVEIAQARIDFAIAHKADELDL